MRPVVMAPFSMGLFEASQGKEILEMRPIVMGSCSMGLFEASYG
jgi:hypothetical protein